jgi:GntR family transcriptional repressor for pyruvate dehydrogenase complex
VGDRSELSAHGQASEPGRLLDRPVESTAAYELVVDRLRRAIHLGDYGPGDRLPSERVLADRLGVSRVTLREAIRVLEGEGYLHTTRGSKGGARVVASELTQDEIRARLRERIDELEALIDFRAVNEGLAARRAARLRTEDEVAALYASVEAIAACDDHAAFRREDSRFHALVARASRLPLLAQAVEEARVAMFLPVDALAFDVLLQTTLRGHRPVVKAIEAQDERAAARAMERHIEATRTDLRRVLG